MNKTLLHVIACVGLALLASCAQVPARKDYMFFPVHLAHFSAEPIDDMTFDPKTNTFAEVPESATAAFYKSGDTDTFKKVTCNSIYFLTAAKEEVKRFMPNRDDLLVMKTGFIPGEAFSILGSERSYPNIYGEHVHFNRNKIEGDYLETLIAIVAVNIGTSPIRTLYIADALPRFMTINGTIRQASKDIFLPLNVELAQNAAVEHKIVDKNGRQVIVYHVSFDEKGLAPGRCVEIIVPIRVPKSELMKDEYKVKE